jgi:CubicO group peptidase (beta-lactamase class C family)
MVSSLRPSFVGVAAALATCLLFQRAAADQPGDALATIVANAHRLGQFQGSVLVAAHGQVVYQGAFGEADADAGRPNAVDTPFRIASVTKGFTAVLVLQAAERGDLSLDARIAEYLPELAGTPVESVTVRHLLEHKSGIPDVGPAPADGQTVRQAIVAHLKDVALATAPGESREYCNVGYTLLGVILEQVTRRSYPALAQERIFAPLDMTHTFVERLPIRPGVRAVGYELVGGRRVRREVDADPACYAGAGGIVSTAPDLLKFSQAFAGDALLAPASRELMFHPDAPLGCKITSVPGLGAMQVFQGGMTGASTLLVRSSDGARTLVLLSNQSDQSLQQLALWMLLSMPRE